MRLNIERLRPQDLKCLSSSSKAEVQITLEKMQLLWEHTVLVMKKLTRRHRWSFSSGVSLLDGTDNCWGNEGKLDQVQEIWEGL